MQKILKYKIEIIYFVLIGLFLFYGYNLVGQNIYSPFSDIGRELYVSEQVKNGTVLYRDILNVYSPLGYWINALIIKLFGSNLKIFTFIGLFLSYISIVPIFLISKFYTNKHIAFFISIFILSSCTFFPSISNWITPYSYGILYALTSILWSIYFVLINTDEKKEKNIFIASILAGITVCFKYEFGLFFLFLISYSIIKKINTKYLLGFIIAPIICVIILLSQGCNLECITDAIKKMINLAKCNTVKYFYDYAGITLGLKNLKNILINFLHPTIKNLFYSIPIINLLLLIYTIKIKKYKLTSLLVISIFTSIKSIGGINLEIYGTYFLPLLAIALIATVNNNSSKFKTTLTCTILAILSVVFINYTINKTKNFVELKTEKGTCKIPPIYYNSTIKVLDYIKTKTQKESKILILPEGAFLNYLSNKKTDDYLYYLIPPNKEILGDKLIKEKILENNIDYIFITNIQYPWYNATSFINSWGKDIVETIKTKYKNEETIGQDFQFYIYKHDIIK